MHCLLFLKKLFKDQKSVKRHTNAWYYSFSPRNKTAWNLNRQRTKSSYIKNNLHLIKKFRKSQFVSFTQGGLFATYPLCPGVWFKARENPSMAPECHQFAVWTILKLKAWSSKEGRTCESNTLWDSVRSEPVIATTREAGATTNNRWRVVES